MNPREVTYSELPADGGRRPESKQPRGSGALKAVAAAVFALALGGAGWWMIEQRVLPAADPAVTKAEADRRIEGEKRREAEDRVARLEAEAKARRLREEKDRADAEEKARQEAAAAARRKAEEDARRRDPILALVPGSGQSARDRLADGSDCPTCPEMVVVPAGAFRMGSPESEEGRRSRESPVRSVTIGEPFAVGRYEVTFAEWDACRADDGCTHQPGDQGWGRGRRPVINVSWDDITNDYLPWLSRRTGKSYRLLSEAEWEYAARAGTTTPFSTGPMIFTDQANFNGNETYGGSSKGQYRQRTIDVGSFEPNAWGLYDMHGNVSEWVQDCWIENYQGAPTDGSARTTTCTDNSRRLLRGGSRDDIPVWLRVAHRVAFAADLRDSHFGFRVARSVSR